MPTNTALQKKPDASTTPKLNPLPRIKHPFTTQYEVLMKHNRGIDIDGQFVGMCEPMTQHYLKILLEGNDPSVDLRDDRKFLIDSIHLENELIDARHAGKPDVTHHVFEKTGTPHTDRIFKPGELKPGIQKALETSRHLLINIPDKDLSKDPDRQHQVYLGKIGYICRFFDVNVTGGERIGPCETLVPAFLKHIDEEYSADTSECTVGMSNG